MAPQAGTLPHISKAKDKVRELKCTLEPWGPQQGQHRVQACLQKLGIIEHPHLPTETLPFFPSQEPLCTPPKKKIKENKKLHQDPCEDGIKNATIPSPSQGQAGVRAQDRGSPVAASPTPCHWRKQRCVFHQAKGAFETKEEAIQGNWG